MVVYTIEDFEVWGPVRAVSTCKALYSVILNIREGGSQVCRKVFSAMANVSRFEPWHVGTLSAAVAGAGITLMISTLGRQLLTFLSP